MSKKYNYIDLFAGCGGLSLGLYNAGWKGLFAIEKNYDAFTTLKHNLIDSKNHFNWCDWLPQKNYEINYVLKKYKKELEELRDKVDLVAGGPPCQGFSSAGRRQENDQRNKLAKSYIQFIKLVRPKLIFFENVKGFTLKFVKNKGRGLHYSSHVEAELQKAGYLVKAELLNFGDYGIPQNRTRFILVGIRNDLVIEGKESVESFFANLKNSSKSFLDGKKLPDAPVLSDAISDLLQANGMVESPDSKGFQAGIYSEPNSTYQSLLRAGGNDTIVDSHRFVNHRDDTVKRNTYILMHSRKNKDIDKSIKEKYNINKHTVIVLDANAKSPTITSLPDDYIHYQEPRSLTVREYARIQSFPDWYEFKGKYTTGGELRKKDVPRYTQIGNAIPPLFGEQIGIVLKTLI